MITALVPAKALDQAKGRLAALLHDEERRELALAMLDDVLRALQAVPGIDSMHVVSPDQGVLDRAKDLGAGWVAEPPSVRGINQALTYALEKVAPTPDAVLVLLADIPGASPSDISSIIGAAPPRGIVICPSNTKGTGALFLRPPGVIPFRFGDLSFQSHRREAAARRIDARVLHLESLAGDVDEPDDLRRLIEQPAETATHRLLARLAVAERLA
jgi:2-phospho-L-lactate guanylyltransferase